MLVNELPKIIKEVQDNIVFLSNRISNNKIKTYFLFVSHQIPECIYLDIDSKFSCNWICDCYIYPTEMPVEIGNKEVNFGDVIVRTINHILEKYNNFELIEKRRKQRNSSKHIMTD